MPSKARGTARPAATQPGEPQVSTAADFKVKAAPLPLPSGKVVRIRRVGFQAFMKAGIIPNSLMGIVEESIGKGTEPNANDMVGDTENLKDMLELIDEVAVFVMTEPEAHRVPKDPKDRDPDVLYVDEIDDEDKMFIFGVTTGGTDDVAQFRKEQKDGMAALQ